MLELKNGKCTDIVIIIILMKRINNSKIIALQGAFLRNKIF